eukprot:304003_1
MYSKMSFQFNLQFNKQCKHLLSNIHMKNINPFICSKYHYQMQSEAARKMLIRKDGREMSTHEIQALFKNMGTLLDEVSKDPKHFRPTDIDGTDELISNLRQIQLEYAPAQLKYLSANFLIWYHGYKAKIIYENLNYISTQYDINSNKKENEFNKFSTELLLWNKYLTDDMNIVWELLDNIDTKILQKEGEIEDEEDMIKIIGNLRINCSLYLNNYEKYLLKSYENIMDFSRSITFLEFSEAELVLTAAPFLGKFDVMNGLIDKLTDEKERECKKNPEILIDKILDLPSGLNWFNLYNMYKNNSKYKEIINNWENEYDLFYDKNDIQRNVNDLCWFKMDNFQSNVLNVFIGNEGINIGNDEIKTDWETIKEKYLNVEYNKQCDIITENNSLIRKMGATCEIICLLGSEQSIFGESILHLTGMWLNNFNNINGDGDRILLKGKNILQMHDLKDKNNNQAYLIHEETWDLFQQYSIDKNNIFVAGMCDTEQRIQSYNGEKLYIQNIPNVIRLRTQIQMTLTKQN